MTNDNSSDLIRWNSIQRKVQEHNAARAFATFRENGIEPILIKGIAAASYYPVEVNRTSIDLDLAVSPKDFAKAAKLVSSDQVEGLAIDLHRGLRHLDTLPWSDLFDNSKIAVTDRGSYRVLRPEDHFRVLSVHWLNDGGVNKERLWDIYYLIDSREGAFDWDRALNAAGAVRRRWFVCLLGLVNKYLGLDLSNTPVASEAKDLPQWLIRTVERVWETDRELIPLWLIIKQPRLLAEQIPLRLDPNPIQATIEMEGNFDARTRIFYKIGNFFQRLSPSVRRNIDSLGNK